MLEQLSAQLGRLKACKGRAQCDQAAMMLSSVESDRTPNSKWSAIGVIKKWEMIECLKISQICQKWSRNYVDSSPIWSRVLILAQNDQIDPYSMSSSDQCPNLDVSIHIIDRIPDQPNWSYHEVSADRWSDHIAIRRFSIELISKKWSKR